MAKQRVCGALLQIFNLFNLVLGVFLIVAASLALDALKTSAGESELLDAAGLEIVEQMPIFFIILGCIQTVFFLFSIWAVHTKNAVGLGLYITGLTVLFFVSLVFTIAAFLINANVLQDKFADQIYNGWTLFVQNSPEIACELQTNLKCSGFLAGNCPADAGLLDDCPENCPANSIYKQQGCYDTIVDMVSDHFIIVAIIGVAITVTLLVGIIFSCNLCVSTRKRDKTSQALVS